MEYYDDAVDEYDGDEYDELSRNDDIDALCDCGRMSIGEGCGQCGAPLCPMCFEGGAGFCSVHPDNDFEGY